MKAVSEYPTPRTKIQLASFLGLVGYFRGHLESFAERAYPLTQLLARHAPDKLQWRDCHQRAFEDLKQALTSKPVLRPPDMTKDFEIWADSSKTTLSAILIQRGDGENDPPWVVSYASRKLLDRETRYSTIERELLSIVFAVTKFKFYVYGKRIVVRSDAKSLQWLNSVVKSNTRLTKWSLTLQDYNLDIQYVPGSQQLADLFTRA